MKKIKFKQIIEIFNNQSIDYSSSIVSEDSFTSINSISNATSHELTFFSNKLYLNQLSKTNAKACLINSDYVDYLPKSCKPILVENPYYALACISEVFLNQDYDYQILTSNKQFKQSKLIDQTSKISPNVTIYSNSTIKEKVVIGPNTNIGPNVVINKNTVIQDNVSISNSIIGENSIIQSGCRIGGSGFGFDPDTKKIIYHYGNVVIEDNCNIGSNTTIDRAVFESTFIGKNSFIDNLIQIAHNVVIGKHAIIAAQVGIAGSTKIGDYVKIGGQAGIGGHLKIGNNVTIAAKSGVTKNIGSNMTVAGFPAKDIKNWKHDIIKVNKLK